MSDLVGAAELRARLKALRTVAKPILKTWGEETARLARQRVPVRTGRTKASIRVSATNRRTSVIATWGARFVEKDTKAHAIGTSRAVTHRKGALKGQTTLTSHVLAFPRGGTTIFARRVMHPRRTGTPFLSNSAREALDRGHLAHEIEKAWDGAA